MELSFSTTKRLLLLFCCIALKATATTVEKSLSKKGPCIDYPSCELISPQMFVSYCNRNTLKAMCPTFCEKKCKDQKKGITNSASGQQAAQEKDPKPVLSSTATTPISHAARRDELITLTYLSDRHAAKPNKPGRKRFTTTLPPTTTTEEFESEIDADVDEKDVDDQEISSEHDARVQTTKEPTSMDEDIDASEAETETDTDDATGNNVAQANSTPTSKTTTTRATSTSTTTTTTTTKSTTTTTTQSTTTTWSSRAKTLSTPSVKAAPTSKHNKKKEKQNMKMKMSKQRKTTTTTTTAKPTEPEYEDYESTEVQTVTPAVGVLPTGVAEVKKTPRKPNSTDAVKAETEMAATTSKSKHRLPPTKAKSEAAADSSTDRAKVTNSKLAEVTSIVKQASNNSHAPTKAPNATIYVPLLEAGFVQRVIPTSSKPECDFSKATICRQSECAKNALWCPTSNDIPKEQLEVVFNYTTDVYMLAIQGRIYANESVTSFLFQFLNEAGKLVSNLFHTDTRNSSAISKFMLNPPVRTNYIRLTPIEFDGSIAMRFELYSKGVLYSPSRR